ILLVQELAAAAGSTQLSIAAMATFSEEAEDAIEATHITSEATQKMIQNLKDQGLWSNNHYITELGRINLTWSLQAGEKIAEFARAVREWRAAKEERPADAKKKPKKGKKSGWFW
ncbi:MAG: hypothetical protein ACH346_07895, partial [Chthoniobacterales bacterium]